MGKRSDRQLLRSRVLQADTLQSILPLLSGLRDTNRVVLVARVLVFARRWNSDIRFRLPKAIQQTLVYRQCALCAIEAAYPTRNGWIKIHASSFHYLLRILVLTWSIAASFSALCAILANLNEAGKDLVPKRKASGQDCYQLDYDVIVLFGPMELQAFLSWKTRVSCKSLCLAVC